MDIKKIIENISVPDSITIREALIVFNKYPLGFLLVVGAKNKLKGVITEGDVRRLILGGKGLPTPIKTFIIKNPVVARRYTGIEEAKNKLSEKIRFIPILNKDSQVTDVLLFNKKIHIPIAEPFFNEDELDNVIECVLSGWISSAGKYIPEFEERFAEYCNTKYGIATSSGTTALHLALLGLGIGPGDEVIVPNFTFIATANAVTYTGAKAIFADIEKDTWNINPQKIESLITKKTKAIMPVHIFGHPCDMDAIMKLAKKHNLFVVEDAAQAHGAEYKGRKVGGIGNIGCFSFYGNKIITTGEGGMVVTNDKAIADKVKILRDHGMDPNHKYSHPYLGYNYRITNMQAGIGVAQMKKIEKIIQRKREIASLYNSGLKNIHGITLPPQKKWAKNVYWLYSILINEKEIKISRDELINKLSLKKIDARPFFVALNKQIIYLRDESLPISEEISKFGLSLPSSVNITNETIKHVIDSVKEIVKSN